MISSASNAHQYHQISATSSATATAAPTSVNTAASTHATNNDQLEESKHGFKNAWLRSLEQEKHVQNTGQIQEHKRVENLQSTQQAQTVADLLSQERNKKV